MQLKLIGAALAAMGALVAAGQAQALTYKVHVKGTVTSGSDTIGPTGDGFYGNPEGSTFGAIGDLAGKPFDLTLHVDTGAAGVDSSSSTSADHTYQTLHGHNTGLLSADLTINNKTVTILGSDNAYVSEDIYPNYYGSFLNSYSWNVSDYDQNYVYYFDYALGHYIYHEETLSSFVYVDVYSYFNQITDANVLDGPGVYTPDPDTYAEVTFEYSLHRLGTVIPSSYRYFGFDAHSSGVLKPTSITVSSAPEPATWGLMLIGFFGAGAMLRRRRVVAALA